MRSIRSYMKNNNWKQKMFFHPWGYPRDKKLKSGISKVWPRRKAQRSALINTQMKSGPDLLGRNIGKPSILLIWLILISIQLTKVFWINYSFLTLAENGSNFIQYCYDKWSSFFSIHYQINSKRNIVCWTDIIYGRNYQKTDHMSNLFVKDTFRSSW